MPQWQPGGKGAHEKLERFVTERLKEFGVDRAKTDRESTSTLSPHIHYGEISNRHIYYVVRRVSHPGCLERPFCNFIGWARRGCSGGFLL